MHKVALAWRQGRPARAGNFSTDGYTIYSYALAIGYTRRQPIILTLPDGTSGVFNYSVDKVAFRFQAPDHFISMTTSGHVARAMSAANDVVAPPVEHDYSARRGICQGFCDHVRRLMLA